MALRLYRVILPVSDIEGAAKFYDRLLGFEGERVSSNRHYFDCGGTILACVDPAGEGLEFRPNLDHVYFAVDDIEAVFKRAKEAGCSWLEDGISSRPWGERSFYAKDPFGNPICFVDEKTVFTGGRFVP
ncbi:MAG: VOC family protein [Chloroflexi bacterium]|nr:VOC family protein [Chloroflexota bacterium]